MTSGPWFVRFAGRRTGPFDAARLRTLARRGALTRMHAVSVDGKSWSPATSLRVVFTEDGSIVEAGADAPDVGLEPVVDDPEHIFGGMPSGEGLEPPVVPNAAVAAPYRGRARVRPVVLGALALASVMLCVPTARDESGALAWWWSQGPLAVSVRGLSCIAVLAAWFIAFAAPEPARSASIAGVAGVLSAAGGASLLAWAPASSLAAPIIALCAVLVALDASGAPSVRFVGLIAAPLAACVGAGSVVLAMMRPHPWAWGAVTAACTGALLLAWAAVLAARMRRDSSGRVFWCCVGASTAAMASMFVTAFGALWGDVPMHAADASVSACLVLSFATVSWAAAHEAAETIHTLGQPSIAAGSPIGTRGETGPSGAHE